MSMNVQKLTSKMKNSILIKIILGMFWIMTLYRTEALFIPYAICFVLYLIAVLKYNEHGFVKKESVTLQFMAFFLSFAIMLANIGIYNQNSKLEMLCQVVLMVISGFVIFYCEFKYLYIFFINEKKNEIVTSKKTAGKVFGITFLLVVAVELFYLFFIAYPGNISNDSLDQIRQILSGNYSNHHPFYHTMLIKICFELGMMLWGNINAAIATYSVFQCIVMAIIFALSVMTIYQCGGNNKCLISSITFYAVMPYNWMYASTMWKDVLFGGMCLLFVTALYRMRQNVGLKSINMILLFIGSLGICLLRSNGIIAFVVVGVILGIFYFKKYKLTIMIMMIAFFIAVVLKGPVLEMLGVERVDTIESLSIPLQQIARTIYDGKDLSEEERQYLEQIMDIEEVDDIYTCHVSDPIKNMCREYGANEVIDNNKTQFLTFWLKFGIKHPYDYIVAWVDQTCGYWNAGYHYWVLANEIKENDLGIERRTILHSVDDRIQDFRQRLCFTSDFLGIMVSTGFIVWAYIVLVCFNLIYGGNGHIELLLGIAIALTLWVATPVFNEFRYAYSLYTMLPLSLFIGIKKE